MFRDFPCHFIYADAGMYVRDAGCIISDAAARCSGWGGWEVGGAARCSGCGGVEAGGGGGQQKGPFILKVYGASFIYGTLNDVV